MTALRQLFLAGTVLAIGGAAVGGATAADLSDYPALSSTGWTINHGSAEFGVQSFIQKPGTSPSNNSAKFNQYGTLTNPVFLNFFDLGAQGYDYKYTFEALGQNVGTNNQAYEVDLNQPGQQYLTFGYVSVPDLRSNTALTPYYGSSNLFIPPGVVQRLYGGIFNGGTPATGAGVNSKVPVQLWYPGQTASTATAVPLGCFVPGQTGSLACKKGVSPVQTTVQENVHRINLGIQRDAGEIDYRWTPSPNWDFQAGYTKEHRYGTQEEGMLFSSGTSTPMAAVPMPVDDYTQNAFISGEYYGISPWGMKWNGMVKYNASIYTDQYSTFSAMNPFGGPGSPVSGVSNCPINPSSTKVANCYGEGQSGTAPSNASNMVTAQVGVDLPGFTRNRYMGTFSFNGMTQNESFIPMTINPGPYYVGTTSPKVYSLSPLSRSSLDGQIDTMLFNNVVTTQLLPNLQNKLNYRYYNYDNSTAPLTLANWIVNNSAIATSGASGASTGNVGNGSYAPHTTLFQSYTKQNAGEQLTWNPTSWATVGGSVGWEQYDYAQTATNQTNEFQTQVFATAHPADWLAVRFNELLSNRFYSNYNWQQFVGNVMLAGTTGTGYVENPYLRDFDIANRTRNAGNLYFDITTPVSGLTITPNVTWRYDYYPADPAMWTSGNGLGLNQDYHTGAGLEIDWAVNASTSLTGAYSFENIHQTMVGTSTSSTALNALTLYNSRMGEQVNTWMLGTTFQLIPDRLSFKVSATYELAQGAWLTGPEPGCMALNSTGTSCGAVSAGNPAYPDTNTSFGHFDAALTYKVDPTLLAQYGKAEIYLQLKYMYERNNVTNWQTSGMSPYMYSTLNASTVAFKDMIFMAGDNPNYQAQAVMASLMVKW